MSLRSKCFCFDDRICIQLIMNPSGSLSWESGRKEMFYLTTHSTPFIYGYMASDIWLRTTQIAREETHCRHMGYSFRFAARVLLYASSHRQDNTYHSLCYTSRGSLAGTRNSSMGPPRRIDPMTHRTMSEGSYHGATSRTRIIKKTKCPWDPSVFVLIVLLTILYYNPLNTFLLMIVFVSNWLWTPVAHFHGNQFQLK